MTQDPGSPTAALDDAAVRRVSITVDGPHTARLEVDGVDVSANVYAAHLSVTAGRLPELVVEISPRRTLPASFEGLARVSVGEAPDPGPAAAAFLSAIDPKLLEEAALNRRDLGTGQHELTKAMLRQLTEWASGRP